MPNPEESGVVEVKDMEASERSIGEPTSVKDVSIKKEVWRMTVVWLKAPLG